jgi:hypothetical protein
MASTGVATIERATSRRRAVELLERDGLLVAVISVCVAALVLRLPSFVNQDTWYALVGGREVLHHGFPGADTLAYWTAGKEWIDQAWFSQVLSYALFSAGGFRLLVFVNVASTALALTLAVCGARRRGAGPRAVAAVVVSVSFLVVAATAQARSQTLVYPLFVCVLLLLLSDERGPSRRVFFVIPILALWANMHASVLIGLALVTLRVVASLRVHAWKRGGLLFLGGVLAVCATPWGLKVIDLYRETLFNPSFKHIAEWEAPSLSIGTSPLYVFAGLVLWLLGRHHQRFTSFERLATLALLAFAFMAIRNVVWLALGAIPILAPTVEHWTRSMRPASPRTNAFLGLTVSALAGVMLIGAALRPPTWLEEAFPAPARTAIAAAARNDPGLKVYSNERYSDWLLFTHPELRGRIAYDIRFELLSQAQHTMMFRWRSELGERWQAAAAGARLIVIDPHTERSNERDLLREPGVRRVYRDAEISVLLRPR